MLNVANKAIMLSVIVLSVVILNVVAPRKQLKLKESEYEIFENVQTCKTFLYINYKLRW
jgi:hypothetical protein